MISLWRKLVREIIEISKQSPLELTTALEDICGYGASQRRFSRMCRKSLMLALLKKRNIKCTQTEDIPDRYKIDKELWFGMYGVLYCGEDMDKGCSGSKEL